VRAKKRELSEKFSQILRSVQTNFLIVSEIKGKRKKKKK